MNDSVAMLTGGASGIGAATADALRAAGFRVVSLDRNRSPVSKNDLIQIEVDLADPQAARAAVAEVVRRYPVTTVIHNAGAVLERPLEAVTAEDLTTLTNLHVATAVTMVQAALPEMKQRRYGRVVLVASRAVLGLANRTAYSATKAALLGLARTWALELGPHGITANVVAPGPIAATRVFHDIIPPDSPKIPGIVQSIPVRRLGRPEDVARAIVFFAAPEAGFITGQTLFVCGGTSVGTIVY